MKITQKTIFNFFDQKYYFLSFVIASLSMFLILSYSGMLSTGKYCLMVGDLWENYVPAIRELCRDVLTGQSIYYSWTHSLGMNTALYNAYYAFSPLNIVYLIFYKVDVNKVTALVIILKVGLAALSFQLYSKHVLKINNLNSVLFSICYSLCAFQVSYNIVNIIWLDALYILPIMLLSIHKMIETGKIYYLVLSFVYLFVSNFYMGYILGLFSFIYIFTLVITHKFRNSIQIFFRYVLSVIISVMITAASWMPVLFFLINNNPDDGTNYYLINHNILNVFYQMFIGQNNGFESISPNVYCGVICVVLIPVFFISVKVDKEKKFLYGMLLIIITMSFIIKPLYILWHAFDAPDGWYNRFSFIMSFIVCVISVITFENIKLINKKVIIYSGVIECIYYIIFCYLINKTDAVDYMLLFMVINFAFIMLWVLLLIAYKNKNNNKNLLFILIMVVCFELIMNGYSSFYRDSRFLPSTPEYIYYGWEDNMKYVSDKLNQTKGFYRVNYYGDVIDNSDTFFGYNGMNDFGSAENPKVRKALSKIGIYTSPRVLEPYGSTQISNMLLGVEYEIEGKVPSFIEMADSYPLINTVDDSLGLAYLVDDNILDFKFDSENAFINNNKLLSTMVGFDVCPFEEINRNEVKITENGISFVELEDRYLVSGNTGECGSIDFVYDGDEDAYIYFVNEKSILDYDSYLLNYGRENIYSDSGVLSVSYIKPFELVGDNQVVEIIQGDYEKQYIKDYYIYSLNNKYCQEAYNILSNGVVSIEEIDDGYVRGIVNVTGNYNTVMTSIPFDPGWTVKIDGEPGEIVPIIDEAFIGIPSLNKGKHVIELKYRAKGVGVGFILSLLGTMAFVTYFVLLNNKKGGKRIK